MSLYVNAYLTRAKKFEVKASKTERGLMLELDVYDGVKIELTPDQWQTCITALNEAGKGPVTGKKPAQKKNEDDY